jgi:hypothetical protein
LVRPTLLMLAIYYFPFATRRRVAPRGVEEFPRVVDPERGDPH